MKVLLSNDDGIHAAGLQALMTAFGKKHEVVVCAPQQEQSGMAHALNVHRPMELIRHAKYEKNGVSEAWSIDGTPTDCVKVYLEAIAPDAKFDAVVSGINHGANLATDVLYSGTVGAAIEGFLHDISSFAVSLDRDSVISFHDSAQLAADYIEKFLLQHHEKTNLLNINFPKQFAKQIPHFVMTRLGKRDYLNAFKKEITADGRTYFTMQGEVFDSDDGEDTDIFAVNRGLVAVTPLMTNLTDFERLDLM